MLEYLEHYQLLSEGESHSYPESLLLVSVDSYKWERTLVSDGLVAPPLWADHGRHPLR